MGIWSEYAQFFGEFRRNFHDTGAILPSGGFLAGALARPLRATHPPARILEVGPGTGSVTRAIARLMRPGDRLDAVEINARFAQLLRDRIAREPAFELFKGDIAVIASPVQELLGESVYDYIVSGLPLNNFTGADVRSIFRTFTRLLKPGGVLTYFEYPLVRSLKVPFVNRAERRRLFRVGRLVGQYIGRHQVRRERIFLNVPPAIVRTLQLKPAPCGASADVLSCGLTNLHQGGAAPWRT